MSTFQFLYLFFLFFVVDLVECSGMMQPLSHILQMGIMSAMMDGVTRKRYDFCSLLNNVVICGWEMWGAKGEGLK